MSRSSVITWALVGIGLAGLLLAVPAVYDNREQKLEVYRAFASAYSEGHRINLANVTTRFDAETEGVISCAPTVLATTLFSRLFRTTTFNQTDFADSSIHIVDPEDQAAQVRIHDPAMNIVRRQIIRDRWRRDLTEALAHLVVDPKQLACDGASVVGGWFVV